MKKYFIISIITMDKLCSAIIGNKYCKNYKGKNNIYCYKHNHLNLKSKKYNLVYAYLLTFFFISTFAIIYNKPNVIVQMYNTILNNNIYFENFYNNKIKKYLQSTFDTCMYYYNNIFDVLYKNTK